MRLPCRSLYNRSLYCRTLIVVPAFLGLSTQATLYRAFSAQMQRLAMEGCVVLVARSGMMRRFAPVVL